MKKVLIVYPYSLFPTSNGTRKYLLGICEYLKQKECILYFLCTGDKFYTGEYELMKSYFGNRLYTVHPVEYKWKMKYYRLFRKLTRGMEHVNYNVDDWYPRSLKRKVATIIKKEGIDVVLVNYIWLSKAMIKSKITKNILLTHDVFTDRNNKTGSDWFSVPQAEEQKALNRANFVLSIQDDETKYLQSLTQTPVFSLYGHINIKQTDWADNNAILFLGSENIHNINGIKYFISELMPCLIERNPNIRLLVAGSVCSHIDRTCKNVELLGVIEDLDLFYSLGNVVINPVFGGTGLKIKSVEALAYGKVLISHPHALEGLPFKDILPALVAENNASFMDMIIECTNTPDYVKILQLKGVEYVMHLNNRFEKTLNYTMDI